MQFETLTEPSALLSALPERIAEFNATESNVGCHMEALPSEGGILRFRVFKGFSDASSLDFVGELIPCGEACRISGEILSGTGAPRRPVSALLYRYFISSLARLTVLLLLYGVTLGISLLVGGRSFLLPAVPALVLLLVMLVRACLARRRLRKRVLRFFCHFLGCRSI